MKNHRRPRTSLALLPITLILSLLLSAYQSPCLSSIPADDETPPVTPVPTLEPAAPPDADSPGKIIINGPPSPPPGFEDERVPVATMDGVQTASGVTLDDVPGYTWELGCSATSAAIIAGFYDRHGFPNVYTGSADSGEGAPLVDTDWGSQWTDGNGDSYPHNPLIASQNGVDGRSSNGTIEDYWISYGSSNPDPYITGVWAQHSFGTSIGDYMRTSQSKYGNADAETAFYNYPSSPNRLTCTSMASNKLPDGTLGMKLFYEARGYIVSQCYNQKTDNAVTGGFTFAQFKVEIDAGHPMLVHLYSETDGGHTVAGIGYDDATGNIYIKDTWDADTHQVNWGGTYSGMEIVLISVINLLPATYLPASLTPADGATLKQGATKVGLKWKIPAGLTKKQVSKYRVQLSEDADFSTYTEKITAATSATFSGLKPNTHYYWRVQTILKNTATGEWASSSFYTMKTKPPALGAPGNKSKQLKPTVVFKWSKPAGTPSSGYTYTLEYATAADFSTGLVTVPGLTGKTHTATLESAGGTQIYYWRVKVVSPTVDYSDYQVVPRYFYR